MKATLAIISTLALLSSSATARAITSQASSSAIMLPTTMTTVTPTSNPPSATELEQRDPRKHKPKPTSKTPGVWLPWEHFDDLFSGYEGLPPPMAPEKCNALRKKCFIPTGEGIWFLGCKRLVCQKTGGACWPQRCLKVGRSEPNGELEVKVDESVETSEDSEDASQEEEEP